MNKKLFEHAFSGDDHEETYTLAEALDFFWGRNLINKGELAEQAISKASSVKQNARNTKGSDLIDGSEIKYSEVFYDKHTTYATIGGIKNKTGTIRAWVYEPATRKNYYFLIPYEVYSKYFENGKKGTMKIWFDKTGKPKNPKNAIYENLWDYKVPEKKFLKFKH